MFTSRHFFVQFLAALMLWIILGIFQIFSGFNIEFLSASWWVFVVMVGIMARYIADKILDKQ